MKGLALTAAAAMMIASAAQAQPSAAPDDGAPRSQTSFAIADDDADASDRPERLWHGIDAPGAARGDRDADGAPTDLSYRLWNPDEPYDFGDGDVLSLGWDARATRLNDIAASAVYGYVVEFEGGAVPEPASWALMIAGFGAVGGAMRRRSAKSVFGWRQPDPDLVRASAPASVSTRPA